MTSGKCAHPWKETWTPDDLQLLKEVYSQWPVDLDPLIGRHSRQACQGKASRLGLTRRRRVGLSFDHVTEVQWAYLAGIIDGEGTIHNYVPKRPGGKVWTNRMVSFTNTDRSLIDWAAATFPGSGIGEREAHDNCKTAWQIRWSRSAALAEMIPRLLPHLIVKKGKAMRLLDSLPVLFTALA